MTMIKELNAMLEKQARVERFGNLSNFPYIQKSEGKQVAAYVISMKGYVDQLEHLGYGTTDLKIGEIMLMLIEYEKGLPKKAETPQIMMINGGKIKKANKKSLKVKGKGKANDKGKDKQVYIPKPKNHKPFAKSKQLKDDACPNTARRCGYWNEVRLPTDVYIPHLGYSCGGKPLNKFPYPFYVLDRYIRTSLKVSTSSPLSHDPPSDIIHPDPKNYYPETISCPIRFMFLGSRLIQSSQILIKVRILLTCVRVVHCEGYWSGWTVYDGKNRECMKDEPSWSPNIMSKEERLVLIEGKSTSGASKSNPGTSKSNLSRSSKRSVSSRNARDSRRESPRVADSTAIELRKKIMSFREFLDLPPCTTSSSIIELVKETVKELHKLHPNVVQCNSISDSEGAMNKTFEWQSTQKVDERRSEVEIEKDMKKVLCVSIKSLGKHWMHSDEWMVKSKKDDVANDDLEKHVLALLDDIIKVTRERMFIKMNMDNGKDTKENADSPSCSYEKSSPTSVTTELQNNKSAKAWSKVTPSSLMDPQVAEDGNVRVQVEILVPPSSLKSIVGAANVQLVPEAGSLSSSAERPSISASIVSLPPQLLDSEASQPPMPSPPPPPPPVSLPHDSEHMPSTARRDTSASPTTELGTLRPPPPPPPPLPPPPPPPPEGESDITIPPPPPPPSAPAPAPPSSVAASDSTSLPPPPPPPPPSTSMVTSNTTSLSPPPP
ncbi:formin-like protein 5 isoform X1, partial [Tanacetum coccineum]